MRVNRGMSWIAISKATGIERHECARLARLEQARLDGQMAEDRGLYTHRSLSVYAEVLEHYRVRMKERGAKGDEGKIVIAAQQRIDELLGLGAPKAGMPGGGQSTTLIALLGDEGVAKLVKRLAERPAS
jgi:hypothetical protein